MEDQQSRIVFGNLKASEKFGDNIVSGALCLEALKDRRVASLVYEYQGKKYLNVKLVKMKQPNQYGKTHVILIDTFVPQVKQEKEAAEKGV